MKLLILCQDNIKKKKKLFKKHYVVLLTQRRTITICQKFKYLFKMQYFSYVNNTYFKHSEFNICIIFTHYTFVQSEGHFSFRFVYN